MVKLEVIAISKKFGKSEILKDISFNVEKDEIFFLLGPSGCGKTTLLRIIAGFISPDKGRILLNGKDITETPPSKRNIGIVFQNYALWPHLSVWKNISYGLEIKKYPYEVIKKKVEKILEITKLTPFKDYYPTKLSGGQQQRVAFARAIVNEPEILLLDEPLSNLDATLRDEMRTEIQRIQKETGITMVYVTHDRKEAMTLGTRIAIMNEGRIVEIGTPLDLYSNPASKFTAEFLGEINTLKGDIDKKTENGLKVITEEGHFIIKKTIFHEKKIEIGFRPENVKINPANNLNVICGNVEDIEYSGETAKIRIETERGNIFFLRLLSGDSRNIKRGDIISFSVSPDDFIVFAEI